MLLDPNTGLTSQQVMKVLGRIIDDNRDALDALNASIEKDYEVSDDVLDELLDKKELSPNDYRTLLRAIGEDYKYLTSDKLDDDYIQSCAKKINGLRDARAWLRANNKVVQNG